MPHPALVVPDRASPPIRDTLAGLPELGVFRMLAHAETAFRPWLALGGTLLGRLQLDPALRELAILRVAAIAGCDYELVQHGPIATAAGVSPDQVDALRAGIAFGPQFDQRETLILRFVGEVIENTGTSAALVEEVEEVLCAREVVELLLVIAQYHGLALLLNTTGVRSDPPAGAGLIEATQINPNPKR